MNKVKNFLAGAGFKTLVFLLVIAVSIPVTIFLIKQQQILKSQATSELIQFTGSNVKTITDAQGNIRKIATLEDVEIELTIPTNTTSSTGSSLPWWLNLVKTVYAACSAGGVYSSCTITCPGIGAVYGGFCYYSNKSTAEQGACDAACPAAATTAPAATAAPRATAAPAATTAPAAGGTQYVLTVGEAVAREEVQNFYSMNGRAPTQAESLAIWQKYVPGLTVAPSHAGENSANERSVLDAAYAASGITRQPAARGIVQNDNLYSLPKGTGARDLGNGTSFAGTEEEYNIFIVEYLRAHPSPSPSGSAKARETTEAGNTIPAGVTITNFKISEADTDTGWSNVQQYPVSQRKVSYKFVPYVCVTQPCDTYPRGLRRIYVQLIGRNADNSEYKQVFSKDIMLALKPVATNVSCEASLTGTGTNIEIKGFHFGDDKGGVSVGSQNATIAQAGEWTNLQTIANISTTISAQSEIILTTADGQKTTPLTCAPGLNTLNFTASASCSSASIPIAEASIEIKEISIGIGSTAPATPTTSIFKKDNVSFTSEGKPNNLNASLIPGQEYNLIIKATNLLSRVIQFKAGKGTTNIENVDLPTGDIAPTQGDCKINSLDRSEVVRQWGRSVSGSAKADFDQNGIVNSMDLACLISNFNKNCDNP